MRFETNAADAANAVRAAKCSCASATGRGAGPSATSGTIKSVIAAARKYEAVRGRAGSKGSIWSLERSRFVDRKSVV